MAFHPEPSKKRSVYRCQLASFLICEFPSELAKPIVDVKSAARCQAGEDHARALFARELCETHRGAINLAKAVLAIDANQLALVAIGPSVIRATKARLMAFFLQADFSSPVPAHVDKAVCFHVAVTCQQKWHAHYCLRLKVACLR